MTAIDGTTKVEEQQRADARAVTERDGRLAAQQDCTLAEPSQTPTQDGRTIADRMAGNAGTDGKPPQAAQEKRQAEALAKNGREPRKGA